MLRQPPSELFEFMTPYAPAVLELMLAMRDRVLSIAPTCTEILYDATYTVVLGYTYTHSHVQGFAHIPAYSSHVDLGFPYGVDLDDAEKRLVGTGSRVRHVKIRSLADLDDPYTLALLADAERKAIRPAEPLEPRQIVKVMKGPKHRPS
jgi:hypothetical protein